MMYYAQSTRGFYPDELLQSYRAAGTLPDDIIELTEQEITSFYGIQPPQGKLIGEASNGRPVWVDAPPDPPKTEKETLESRQSAYRTQVDPLRAEAEMERAMGNADRADALMQQAVNLYQQIKADNPKPAEE